MYKVEATYSNGEKKVIDVFRPLGMVNLRSRSDKSRPISFVVPNNLDMNSKEYEYLSRYVHAVPGVTPIRYADA